MAVFSVQMCIFLLHLSMYQASLHFPAGLRKTYYTRRQLFLHDSEPWYFSLCFRGQVILASDCIPDLIFAMVYSPEQIFTESLVFPWWYTRVPKVVYPGRNGFVAIFLVEE